MSTLSTPEVSGLSFHPHQQQVPALLWLFCAEMMAENSEGINWIFSRLVAFRLEKYCDSKSENEQFNVQKKK